MNCASDVSSTTNQCWTRTPDPGDKVSLYFSLQVVFFFFLPLFFLYVLQRIQDEEWKWVRATTILEDRGPDFRCQAELVPSGTTAGVTPCPICKQHCISWECKPAICIFNICKSLALSVQLDGGLKAFPF